MHTIKLKISDSAYDKFKSLLDKFNDKDVIIIKEEDNSSFTKNQEYLQKELKNLESGKSRLVSQEDFEDRLNRGI